MKEKIKKVIKDTDFIYYMCIVVVACILSIPILNRYLDVYFDDGIQHIARAFGTLKSIRDQGAFPNIISSFANGFGYSWNLFYGPLSTYGILFINLISKSFVTSYKILNFICLMFSGIFMYKFIMSVTKNSNISLLASVIYMTFPYHLTDWYTRNALGELMSFVFVPLVFWGLYQLLNTTEKHYYLTFGAVGLVLTHNICTFITCIFSAIYLLIHFKNLKETRVKQGLVINFIFIITITSFFWAPMLETKFSTEYQVYQENAMSTKESVAESALNLKRLFITPNDTRYVFELGMPVCIMLCFSIMSLKNLTGELKKQYIFCFVSGLVCIIMSTNIWPWKYMPSILTIIQFPWRMLFMAGFFLSIVCGINMFIALKNFNLKDVIVISAICVIYMCAFKANIPTDKGIAKIEDWSLGKISGKEVEVVAGTGKAEYLPKKAFENRFYIATRENTTYVLSGIANVKDEEKYGSYYKAKIQTNENIILELPFIYYPGYKVTADGIVLENFETENGFLGVLIEKNENVELVVEYTGTKIMRISLLISVIGIIAFSIYVWKKH